MKFGVYGDGFPIGVHRLFIFFLFGEDQSETRKSVRIFGVFLHPEPPLSFRANEIALLFERHGSVRTRRLRLDREREQEYKSKAKKAPVQHARSGGFL